MLVSLAPTQDGEVFRGFEPRSLDSGSRVLTVTPRDHLNVVRQLASEWVCAEFTLATCQCCQQTEPACATIAAWVTRRPVNMCMASSSVPDSSVAHAPCPMLAHPHTRTFLCTETPVWQLCGCVQKVSRGFEPRSLDSGFQSANRYTTRPFEGS